VAYIPSWCGEEALAVTGVIQGTEMVHVFSLYGKLLWEVAIGPASGVGADSVSCIGGYLLIATRYTGIEKRATTMSVYSTSSPNDFPLTLEYVDRYPESDIIFGAPNSVVTFFSEDGEPMCAVGVPVPDVDAPSSFGYVDLYSLYTGALVERLLAPRDLEYGNGFGYSLAAICDSEGIINELIVGDGGLRMYGFKGPKLSFSFSINSGPTFTGTQDGFGDSIIGVPDVTSDGAFDFVAGFYDLFADEYSEARAVCLYSGRTGEFVRTLAGADSMSKVVAAIGGNSPAVIVAYPLDGVLRAIALESGSVVWSLAK
jgi:hypothetical protein